MKYCGAPIGGCEHQKSEQITKEGIEVKAGQVWRDLDKRMSNRCVRVLSVADGKATVARTNPTAGWVSNITTKLSIRRMHKGSTGWALVQDVNRSKLERRGNVQLVEMWS